MKELRFKRTALLEELRAKAYACIKLEDGIKDIVENCRVAGVTRKHVIEALVSADWSESRARAVVSEIYTKDGRMRKPGAGRKTPGAAIRIMNYTVKFCRSKRIAASTLLAAYRHLKKKIRPDIQFYNEDED